MSDTPQQAAPAPAPETPRPPRLYRLRVALGLLPEPDKRPPYIWVERKDALMVALLVAFGLPLLGLSRFDMTAKLIIVCAYGLTVPLFFFYFEGREIIGQMMGRGAMKQEQWSEQQRTAQYPFFGLIVAAFVWLTALLVQLALRLYGHYDGSLWRLFFVTLPVELWSWIWHGEWHPWINYQVYEWVILFYTWFMIKRVNYIIYNAGNTFSKIAIAERVERNVP